MKNFFLAIVWGVRAIWDFIFPIVFIAVLVALVAAPTVITSLIWSYDSVGVWVFISQLGLLLLAAIGTFYGGEYNSRGQWIGWKTKGGNQCQTMK